jgi:hypothetical protein
MSIWLALSVKGKARFVISGIYIGLTLISISAKLDIILDILALLSVSILIFLLACNRFVPKITILSKDVDTDLSTNYLAIVGFVIAIAGIIASCTSILFISPSASMSLRNYSYELFVLLCSFSPLLMTILILCLPVKLLFSQSMSFMTKDNKNRSQYVSKSDTNNESGIKTISRTKIIFYLSIFIFLSASIALIPHQPALNKDNRPVGADSQDYVTAIKRSFAYSKYPLEFVKHLFFSEFGGDRPISLLFFYALIEMLKLSPTYIIDYMPVILGPTLVLVVYFLTFELTSNYTISILAAFLTALSFQTLIGIYAGFYANWFALIIGYSSFVYLFKYLKRPSRSNFIIYFILIILLLFSHVYTWSILAISTTIFLLVMLKLNYYQRRNIILLLLVVLSSLVVDVARFKLTGSTSGIEGDIHLSYLEMGPKQFISRWNNIIDTTQYFLGGLFGNFIIIALGLYWLFRANYVEAHNIFIVIFLSIGVIPLFLGDWTVQSRVFYNIPFQIPAAIALNYIKQGMKGTMISLAVCIWLTSISIMAVSNFI